jgi:hypothetical protein
VDVITCYEVDAAQTCLLILRGIPHWMMLAVTCRCDGHLEARGKRTVPTPVLSGRR